MSRHVLVKNVVVRLSAHAFQSVHVLLNARVFQSVHVFQYARVCPCALAVASLVALHYVRVVVSHAWAYVIVAANQVDYVVVLVYQDVLVYQLVLVAVAHLVRAPVSDTHHRVLATLAQYVVH